MNNGLTNVFLRDVKAVYLLLLPVCSARLGYPELQGTMPALANCRSQLVPSFIAEFILVYLNET
jgi:hypothetical protein